MQRARGAALLAVVAAVFVAVFCSACSGGDGGKAFGAIGPPRRFCSLVAQLDGTGAAVARADIDDPGQFDAALDAAVQRYTNVLDQLQSAAPASVAASVARLRADVRQRQFTRGEADHAALKAYAAHTCP